MSRSVLRELTADRVLSFGASLTVSLIEQRWTLMLVFAAFHASYWLIRFWMPDLWGQPSPLEQDAAAAAREANALAAQRTGHEGWALRAHLPVSRR